MSAAALAPISSIHLPKTDIIECDQARIFHVCDRRLGILLIDQVNSVIERLFEKFPPTAYFSIELGPKEEKIPFDVFCLKEPLENEKGIYHFLKTIGLEPFSKEIIENFFNKKFTTSLSWHNSTKPGDFVLQSPKKSISCEGKSIYLFHYHLLPSLKKCLKTPVDRLIERSMAKTIDKITSHTICVEKLKKVQQQFFLNLSQLEESIRKGDSFRKDTAIITIAPLERSPLAKFDTDCFILKKINEEYKRLCILFHDSHQWRGTYKTASLGYDLFKKAKLCVFNITNDLADYKQEMLVRTHPLIKLSPHIPKTIAFWASEEQQVFVTKYACYGTLKDFLSKNPTLSLKDRNNLVLNLLTAFIELSPYLHHKDIKDTNILVKQSSSGPKILVNDFGGSALKEAICPDPLKKEQREKLKEVTANTYLLSPEMIGMSYELTRLQAQNEMILKADKEGISLDAKTLKEVEGSWFNRTWIRIDGTVRADLDLTEEHWKKTTVFILGQLIFNILFGFDLYGHLFDFKELDAMYPYIENTFSEAIKNPLSRLHLHDPRFMKESELKQLEAFYESAHHLILARKKEHLENLGKTDSTEPLSKCLIVYPEKIETALASPEHLYLIDAAMQSSSQTNAFRSILRNAYQRFRALHSESYSALLAKFICLGGKIDFDKAVPVTADNLFLRERITVIARMLEKDPSKRISLEEAKKALEELSQKFPL